jgi:hypothetical protein
MSRDQIEQLASRFISARTNHDEPSEEIESRMIAQTFLMLDTLERAACVLIEAMTGKPINADPFHCVGTPEPEPEPVEDPKFSRSFIGKRVDSDADES